MEGNALEQLVRDFAVVIAKKGIELETLANRYLLKNRTRNECDAFEGLANEEQYLHGADCLVPCHSFDNGNYRSAEETPKNSAFQYYLERNSDKYKEKFPDYTVGQIATQAANDFKGLTQAEKLPYLRLYLKENKYQDPLMEKNSNLRTNSHSKADRLSSGFGLNQHESYGDMQVYGMLSLFDQEPHMQKQPYLLSNKTNEQNANEEFFGLDFSNKLGSKDALGDRKLSQEGYGRTETEQSRSKTDAYRLNMASKGEKGDKQHSRSEDPKDKSDFHTLKSLFKKLQRNA